MRLDRIHLKNFFNHRDTQLHFNEVDSPVLIIGSNGAGKTTATIESFSYALFGETRVENIDDAIRNEENEMSVTVQFDLNGQNVEITRSKKRGKSQKLQLIIDGVEIEELLSELQKRINALINLSPESFRSSIFLRQDDSNFFAKAKPDERKKIISEILDLQQYERLEKLAREERTELKSAIKAKQISIDSIPDINIPQLEEELEEASLIIDKASIRIVDLEEKWNLLREYNSSIMEKQKIRDEIAKNNLIIEKRIKENTIQISDNEDLIASLQTRLKTYKDVDTDILFEKVTEHQNTLNDLTEKESDLKDAYNKVIKDKVKVQNEIIQQFSNIHQANVYAVSSEENNINKLEKLDDADCPTCLRPISTKEVKHMHSSFSDKLKEAKAKFVLSKADVEKAQQIRNDISEGGFKEAQDIVIQRDKLREKYKDIKFELDKLQISYTEAMKNAKFVIKAKEQIVSLNKEIATFQKDEEFLSQQIKKVPLIKEELKDESQIKDKLRTIKESQNTAIATKAKIENNIENAQKEIGRKAKTMEDIGKAQSKLALLELLVLAFSKNGIPASIIDTVLPEIQENANFYLAKMSEDSLEFKFNTTTKQKNGDEKNTLDLSVYDGNIWRNFDSLSGGEQFRVSLSIRLALSNVLMRRANVQLETIILDEPGVNLDNAGRESFCAVIKSLKDIFPRIILTTHIPQLADEFESRIQLDKSAYGTKVII